MARLNDLKPNAFYINWRRTIWKPITVSVPLLHCATWNNLICFKSINQLGQYLLMFTPLSKLYLYSSL